jgi:hypothetical protein
MMTRHDLSRLGATLVQVKGMGPFDIHYLDPRDDPQSQR